MPSQKQIDANRRNALKSTGPTTTEGKAASSLNAVKTGLYAKSAVIKDENPADLQALTDDYYNHHRPDTPELRSIVNQLIQIDWELRRISGISAQMWDYQVTNSWTAGEDQYPLGKAATIHAKTWSFFQRRMDSLHRNQLRLLGLLREHRVNPSPSPNPPLSCNPNPS
jgi:hypothetical protein